MILVPHKLRKGDQVRVLAISRTLGGMKKYPGISKSDIQFATQQIESLGLRVSFGDHVMECDDHLTTSAEARLADLHQAILDPDVRAVLAVSGGIGAIQLIEGFNFSLLASYPKIFSGYSDVAVLWNAIYARTRLVTYYGPNFATFMNRKAGQYTLRNFHECLFTPEPLILQPSETWSDDVWIMNQENRKFHQNPGWWPIQEGHGEGIILGGSIYGLNLLQGSEYAPPLQGAILFLEHPGEGKASLMSLDTMLRALALQPAFKAVKGIVIGRYNRAAEITRDNLQRIIHAIPALASLPVAANCDFGHTTPMLTLPLGGVCRLKVTRSAVTLSLEQH